MSKLKTNSRGKIVEPYRWEEDDLKSDGLYDGRIMQGDHRVCLVTRIDFYMIQFLIDAMNEKGPLE